MTIVVLVTHCVCVCIRFCLYCHFSIIYATISMMRTHDYSQVLLVDATVLVFRNLIVVLYVLGNGFVMGGLCSKDRWRGTTFFDAYMGKFLNPFVNIESFDDEKNCELESSRYLT